MCQKYCPRRNLTANFPPSHGSENRYYPNCLNTITAPCVRWPVWPRCVAHMAKHIRQPSVPDVRYTDLVRAGAGCVPLKSLVLCVKLASATALGKGSFKAFDGVQARRMEPCNGWTGARRRKQKNLHDRAPASACESLRIRR